MRLSFVQRLKNQKHQTVPTRESQQKSTSHSIKIKSHSLKNQKKDVAQHCKDIRNLISFLEETKNPESEINLYQKYAKSKTEERKQEKNQWDILREDRKENSVKLARPSSGSYQREEKQFFIERNKKVEEKKVVDFDVKFQQSHEQTLLYQSSGLNFNPNKLLPYRFGGKKKLEAKTILSPIGIESNKNIELKKEQINPKQSTDQNQKPARQFICTTSTKRGLQNIGNTCYINSILQCLFHFQSFSEYFADRQYLKKENLSEQKFNSDRSIVEKYRELYLYVMKGQGTKQNQKKSTYSLKLALSKSCSLFLDWQQEDAHQFMRKLLDSMHQEINRSKVSSPYNLQKIQTKLQYSSISALADEYFQYFKQKDDSYIYDCFEGQLYNNIECVNCHSQSVSFENCLDLCLPLVKGKNTLEGLLEEFFGKERLDDFYSCENCKKTNKNSIKTTRFWRFPSMLIIQLKRSQCLKKNLEPITFPIDLLNLQNYKNSENNKISHRYSDYALKSVINHRGAASGGHYWSVIREGGLWWEIDDEKVVKLQGCDVKRKFEEEGSQDAYVLFYESMSR